jgi:hypothetical protein
MQSRRGQTRAADKIGGAEMGYAQQGAAGAFGWRGLDFAGRFKREKHQIQVPRRMRVFWAAVRCLGQRSDRSSHIDQSRRLAGRSRVRIGRAGTPTAIVPAARERMTTEPAPMTTSSPMSTPAQIVTFEPHHTREPMLIG